MRSCKFLSADELHHSDRISVTRRFMQLVKQKLLKKIELQITRCMDWTRILQDCLKQATTHSTEGSAKN